MSRLLCFFALLLGAVAFAATPTVIITHASQDWDHLEETKWPALAALNALRQWAPGPVPVISLQGGNDPVRYFLSSLVDPASIVYSKEGELPVRIRSPWVVMMGGNFSDCNRVTVNDLLRGWGRDGSLSTRDLEVLFVTPAIYDYARGQAPGLEYPEEIQAASRTAQAQRRARTGIGSPTFRLDWILDHLADNASRLTHLCGRMKAAYEAGISLPDHGITVQLGTALRQCTDGKHVLRFRFLYPNAPGDLSLTEAIRGLFPPR